MKACIIQAPYGTEFSDADKVFEKEIELLDSLDESIDIAVLPESCDAPAFTESAEERSVFFEKYNNTLLEKCSATAKRCNCLIFVSARSKHENGFRNTTFVFDRNGEIIGRYYKQHLTPRETKTLDSGYSFDFSEPTVLTIEGIRFAFLTCYDFYFYDAISNIARQNVDIIIGCSHQRTDTHDALRTMSKYFAYNCNAYVLRASVSMGDDSPVGGTSLIAAPNGDILTEIESRVGIAAAEFDPKEKYFKPAGYNNPPSAHWQYVEKGRRPWKYRPAGSAIVRYDSIMDYPRVCAHRGFNTVLPENSLPAFGAAVALGAEEIEFDLWPTADGEIVSIHDPTLERVSDGSGKVYEKTYEELLCYDFGIKYGERFKGLKIPRFEDILKKLAGHTVMNIHIKTVPGVKGYDKKALGEIVRLIDKYDCRRHVYFMNGDDDVAREIKEFAPDIPLCLGAGNDKWNIVDRAISIGCQKVQFHRNYMNEEMIKKAHENGIRCNVFWSDDPDEAVKFIKMGIDTVLTNDYLTVGEAVKKYKENR